MDCLPMVKSVYAINHSEIRRDCVASYRCVRLLVVPTEDRDLCSCNREIETETCEIEVQGNVATGSGMRQYAVFIAAELRLGLWLDYRFAHSVFR